MTQIRDACSLLYMPVLTHSHKRAVYAATQALVTSWFFNVYFFSLSSYIEYFMCSSHWDILYFYSGIYLRVRILFVGLFIFIVEREIDVDATLFIFTVNGWTKVYKWVYYFVIMLRYLCFVYIFCDEFWSFYFSD